jgi:hypothetical protein
MATQFSTAATFDGGHDLELTETQMTSTRLTPGSALGTEDIRNLQRVGHGLTQVGGSIARAPRGLWVSRKVLVAT